MRETSSVRQAISTAGKVLLVLLAIPFAALAALLTSIFNAKANRTAAEVATYLRNFIEGEGAEPWEWDDFTSVPIANQQLDTIRRSAAAVDNNPSDAATDTLRRLLAEAERLAEIEAQS